MFVYRKWRFLEETCVREERGSCFLIKTFHDNITVCTIDTTRCIFFLNTLIFCYVVVDHQFLLQHYARWLCYRTIYVRNNNEPLQIMMECSCSVQYYFVAHKRRMLSVIVYLKSKFCSNLKPFLDENDKWQHP